jgi:hypothetical protein
MKGRGWPGARITFWILFAFLGVLIAVWFLSFWSLGRSVEPLASNTRFRYTPNRRAVNAATENIEFGIADLEDEAKYVCEFLKTDNQLLAPALNAASASAAAAATASMATDGFMATDGSMATDADKKENSSPVAPSLSSATKTGGDTAPAASPPPAVVMDGDYTQPRTDLEIHKMYQEVVSETQLEKAMDAVYGPLFDVTSLRDMTNAQIAAKWKAVHNGPDAALDLHLYDRIAEHTAPLQSAVQPAKTYDFFLQMLQTHNADETALKRVRNTLYAIVGPRYKQRQLFRAYLDNATRLQNIDQRTVPSNNSMIYVLNACSELFGSSNNGSSGSSSTGNANNKAPNFEDTTTFLPILDVGVAGHLFTVDTIRLYQCASLLGGLKTFVQEVQQHAQPSIRSLLATDVPRFVAGFPKFVAKQSALVTPSVCVYVLTHPPSDLSMT